MTEQAVRVRWTSEMEDILVDLWQDHECLYNVSCRNYHIRTEKDRSWRDIAAALSVPGNFEMQHVAQALDTLWTFQRILYFIYICFVEVPHCSTSVLQAHMRFDYITV